MQPGALDFQADKEVMRMRKHRKGRAVSARDVALAACRAILATADRKADIRRATVLARFAVAMVK
jgi:hypothetical protein